MLYIVVLISIQFANLPSLAVQSADGSDSNEPAQLLTSLKSPLDRWLELYRQIYEDHGNATNAVNLANVKIILHEMLSIEQNDLNKSDIKPFDRVAGQQPIPFRSLVQKAYGLNLLDKPDATITELLLQTFKHDDNDCTESYLNSLKDIYMQFDRAPISKALQESHQLQLKNCLDRSRRLLSTATVFLGTKVNDLLERLFVGLYPNSNDFPVDLWSFNDSQSDDQRNLSEQIIKKIAMYLTQQQQASDDSKLKHFVLHPCAMLISETKQIITKVLAMINLNKHEISSMNRDDAMVLRKYLLCHRIISVFTNPMTRLTDSGQILLTGSRPIDTTSVGHDTNLQTRLIANKTPDTRGISTELKLGLNDNEQRSSANDQLITQQIPCDLFEDDGNLQQTNPPHGNKQKYVVKIDKTNARGRNVAYTTHWSDGTTTMELKSHLMANWPDKLQELYEEIYKSRPDKMAQERTRMKSSILPRREPAKIPLLPNLINANLKRVISIDRCTGRGLGARYPTLWSDGTTSWESRNYLQTHWPNEFNSTLKRFATEDHMRFRDRCRAKSVLSSEDVARNKKRARIESDSSDKMSMPDQNEAVLDRTNPDSMARFHLSRDPTNVFGVRERKVISIENFCSCSGGITKFRTNWSDGGKTMESREYLINNWPLIWLQFDRQRHEERRARHAAKVALKEQSKATEAPKLRPILPKPKPNEQRANPRSQTIQRLDPKSIQEIINSIARPPSSSMRPPQSNPIQPLEQSQTQRLNTQPESETTQLQSDQGVDKSIGETRQDHHEDQR